MTGLPAAATIGGLGLLERAIGYALGSLHGLTRDEYARSTPCADWDLGSLLRHMNDSLLALHEAADTRDVGLMPIATVGDPAIAWRERAGALLGAWTNADGRSVVSVAGCPITTAVVASTGALEVAVHAWDVAQARGSRRPLPEELAEELFTLAPLFIAEADRPGRFGPAVEPPPHAGAADRLVAFLGRRP